MSDYYLTSSYSVSAIMSHVVLRFRIKRRDLLIMFYKILHGHVDVDRPELVNTRLTRGNDLKFI